MSIPFLNGVDLNKTQLFNAAIHNIAGDASSPNLGQIWYNSTAGRLRVKGASANLTLVTDGGDLSAASVANTALATNPLARANHTGTQLAATVSDFDTQVHTSTLNQLTAPTADLSINTHKLTNVVDPTSAQDAATKNYVDALLQGLKWKKDVRAASTTNVTIASALINGLVMDAVTLATGDDVLLKNQTAPAENGIWTVVASGAASRRNDADTATEVTQMAMFVREGTVAGDTQWVNTTNAPITLGTTGLVFAQVGGGTGVTAGNGLTGTTTISVLADPTPADIIVGAAGIKTDPAKIPHIYSTTVGDGSSTSITVTHNLGTRSVMVQVFLSASTFDTVMCDILRTTTNTVTLVFAVAPTSAQYTCVVHG